MMMKINYQAEQSKVLQQRKDGLLSDSECVYRLSVIHRGLLCKIAKPYNLTDDEITGIGYLATDKALNLWDESRGKFTTILSYCMRSELRKLLDGSENYKMISLDDPIPQSDGLTVADTLADDIDYECQAIDEITKQQLCNDVAVMLSQLPIEQRRAVTERFFDGQKVNDRSTYQKAMRTISTARNRRILSQYLERNDFFSGTGLSNFRRTGSTMPERIIIQIHDGR